MILKKIIFVLINLTSLTFFACSRSPGPMGNGGHMMGCSYGGGFMWLIVLILAGVAIYYLVPILKSKGFDGLRIETSLDILKKRYAKGEIDKEEFDRKKNDLES